MKPEVEQLLQEFLGREKRDAADGYTNRALAKTIATLTDQVTAHERSTRDAIEHVHKRLDANEFRLTNLEAERANPPSDPPPALKRLVEADPDDNTAVRNLKQEMTQALASVQPLVEKQKFETLAAQQRKESLGRILTVMGIATALLTLLGAFVAAFRLAVHFAEK